MNIPNYKEFKGHEWNDEISVEEYQTVVERLNLGGRWWSNVLEQNCSDGLVQPAGESNFG